MSEIKYVKISPFYNGPGFYDSKSGIFFSKKNPNAIKIGDNVDVSNIRYYIRRNYLIDVSTKYDVDARKEAEQKQILENQANNVSFKTLLKEEAYDNVKAPVEQKEETKTVEDIEKEIELDVTVEDAVEEEIVLENTDEEVVEEEKSEAEEDVKKQEIPVQRNSAKKGSKKRK